MSVSTSEPMLNRPFRPLTAPDNMRSVVREKSGNMYDSFRHTFISIIHIFNKICSPSSSKWQHSEQYAPNSVTVTLLVSAKRRRCRCIDDTNMYRTTRDLPAVRCLNYPNKRGRLYAMCGTPCNYRLQTKQANVSIDWSSMHLLTCVFMAYVWV